MQKGLTERFIRELGVPQSGYTLFMDKAVRGLGVRVTSNGVKSFILDYRIRGKRKRYTIGRWPEWNLLAARDEAIRLHVQIRSGDDPMQTREFKGVAPTVADLSRKYLEEYASKHKRASSFRNDSSMLESIVLPQLGSVQVRDLTRDDIEELHSSLKGTPYQANRVLSLLSKMLNLSVSWGMRSDNPIRTDDPNKRIKRFHEERREGWLNAEQLAALQVALDHYAGQDAADALRLLILTGSREGEVLNADWSQFDLERGIWTKPSHSTKQNTTEHIALGAPALALLKRRARVKTGEYVFPGADGKKPRASLDRPWKQACRAAGLVSATQKMGKRKLLTVYKPIFRLHDLRHTFASNLVNRGVGLQIVGSLLGHRRPETTARYSHVANEAQRAALKLIPWTKKQVMTDRQRRSS